MARIREKANKGAMVSISVSGLTCTRIRLGGLTHLIGMYRRYGRPTKLRVWNHLIIIAFLALPVVSKAQVDSTSKAQEDNPSTQAQSDESAANPHNTRQNTTGPGATKDPDISWTHLPMRILEDQKDLWLFPTQLARGRHWVPTLAITGVTGALIAADPHDQSYFRDNKSFEETSEIFSTSNTAIVEIGVPVTTYVVGLLRRDSYTTQTALLSGEAYVDSTIAQVVIGAVSHRLRPREVAPAQDFRDTFFRGRATDVFTKGTSFPSAHATAGFAIATVMARRYGKHKWVPWVAYGVAGLISVSRIPDMAHFPSDVFLGAALGYTITRFDVFRERNQ